MSEREKKRSQFHPISTRVGHAGWSDHRFRGFSLFEELTGRTSLTQLFALAITQRCFNDEDCQVIDEVACIMLISDPRIYPFKMTRLAAAASGNLFLAHAVGNLIQTGKLIGSHVCEAAASNLVRLMNQLGDRYDDSSAVRATLEKMLAGSKFFPGFGLPIRPADERLVALEKSVKRHKRHERPYWKLMQQCQKFIHQEFNMIPNSALGTSAILLDMGITPAQCSAFLTALVQPAFIANALEGSINQEELLKRLPEEDIEYVGAPPRTSPRAQNSSTS